MDCKYRVKETEVEAFKITEANYDDREEWPYWLRCHVNERMHIETKTHYYQKIQYDNFIVMHSDGQFSVLDEEEFYNLYEKVQ